jgi:hypothetical protein
LDYAPVNLLAGTIIHETRHVRQAIFLNHFGIPYTETMSDWAQRDAIAQQELIIRRHDQTGALDYSQCGPIN